MKFVVVDRSASLLFADLAMYAAAQQRQLREHYAACYDGDGCADEVRVASAPTDIMADEYPLMYEAIAPAADVLGTHDLNAAHVYKDLCDRFGNDWRSVMSHEALEARADRRLHACVELDDGTIWDREICDRVEADSYITDGVPLSNFNTPQCFEPAGTPGEAYDWMKLSTKPNEVRPGGYAQRYDANTGWSQVGQMRAYRAELAARGLSRGSIRRARTA